MSIYKISDIFASAKSSDFPYIYPQFSYKKGDVTRVKITPENVEPEEVSIFSNFLNELGLPNEDVEVENFGFVTFKGKESGRVNPVYFGIDPETEQMCLSIGETNEKFDSRSTKVSCEVEYVAPNPKRPDVKKWMYTLNGVEIKLVEATDNQGKGQGWYYLSLQTTDDDIYTFSFLADKTKKLTSQDISTAFKEGRFHEVLAKFGSSGGGSYCWTEANKAFIELFRNKAFPKEGIHLLVCDGQIKITEKDETKGIDNTIVKSEWRILATSHPDIFIQYKDTKTKTIIDTTLETATFMSFSSAANDNEGYTFFTTKGLNKFKGVALIHIQKMNRSGDIKHIPMNTLTTMPKRIIEELQELKINPKMLQVYADYIQNNECDTIYPQMDAKRLIANFLSTLGTTKKEDGIDFQDARASILPPSNELRPRSQTQVTQSTDSLVQTYGDSLETEDVLGKF